MKAENSTDHSGLLNPFLNVFGSDFAQNSQLLSKLVMSLYFEQDINAIAPPGNKR